MKPWVPAFFFLLLQAAPSGAAWPPAVPREIVLTVRETAGVARTDEVVRSGVPLPRSLGLLGTSGLAVVDAASRPVPAEFQVLSRWHAGRNDAGAPVQWLLVTFPATVPAGSAATYRLVADGSVANPAPATPLRLTRSGDRVTVETGAATFVLGGSSGALFDEARSAGGTRLISGGAMIVRTGGTDSGHPTTRRVRIEHAGLLAAVVVVEGAYGMPAVGGGGLGSLRRYVFTAGSPTAVVRHAVAWEGDRCGAGVLVCGGAPNGVRLQRVRDALDLDLGSPRSVQAVGSFASPAVSGTAVAGQGARVRQLQRASRTTPLSFEVAVPGAPVAGGQKADGGMLAVGTAAGTLAVALARMHRYEPQALRLLADGRLAIDLADGAVWLGARQGLFSTLAVAALAPGAVRSDLDRQVWAPLNHPLRAWPSAHWFAASGAVDEFPVGPLPPDLQGYDTLMAGVLGETLTKVDEKGLAGLMTFGLYPREWGRWFDELDCAAGADPTPGETWDDAYWCATWTDYHNALATAPVRALRSGEVAWLDDIAVPGALRVLHTQIQQCAPSDSWFYCGQAPAGYGGYRADFNSSHAYFENLFLYYWLTGDSTVVETLRRGAASMRNYLCSRRPAAPCAPDDPPTDEWAHLTGRVAMQWFEVFRFLGLAGDDVSYLEDWRSGLARAVTQHYVQAVQGGRGYGFWMYGGDPVDGPGTDSTDQLWMISLYDMNALYRLGRDALDAPIGNPALAPSAVLAAWARTLADLASVAAPGGDGTARGDWPNALFFTWSGPRVGGALVGTAPDLGGGDPLLYDTGKACLAAAVVRTADSTGDPALRVMGLDLTRRTLAAALSELQPLGKIQGLYLSRLHAAVARLAPPPAPASYYTLTPCRVVDTRGGAPLVSEAPRVVAVAGVCGVPATATAVAANLTAVAPTVNGHLTAYPAGFALPATSALNFGAGQTRANSGLLSLGNGQLSVQATLSGSGQVHFVLDVSGYFE